jgi:hypothetical protein
MHASALLSNTDVRNCETFDNAAYQATCAVQESKYGREEKSWARSPVAVCRDRGIETGFPE